MVKMKSEQLNKKNRRNQKKEIISNALPSTDSRWSALLMRELKDHIKRQGYNYKDIARVLKMSESGFKKLINSKDCSLQKIETITHIIGIRMMDLFSAIEAQHLMEFDFTKNQEEFFLSKREGFLLYWLLVYERRSLDEARTLLQMDMKKSSTLLRKMDQLNLLKVFPNERLVLPQPMGIQWSGRSRFMIELYHQWGHDLLKAALKNLSSSDPHHFSIRYLKMSQSTWNEFKISLENLEKKIVNTAVREMRMNVPNLKHVRWLMIADQISWVDQEISQNKGLRNDFK